MHARVQIALGREYSDATYINHALKLLELTENNDWGKK